MYMIVLPIIFPVCIGHRDLVHISQENSHKGICWLDCHHFKLLEIMKETNLRSTIIVGCWFPRES